MLLKVSTTMQEAYSILVAVESAGAGVGLDWEPCAVCCMARPQLLPALLWLNSNAGHQAGSKFDLILG